MDSTTRMLLIAGLAATLSIFACEEQGTGTHAPAGEHGHAHDDGHDHDGDDHADGSAEHDHGDDDHALESLGTVALGDMTVEAFQGHGQAAAGKELHLLVRLPESAQDATVRAWIGTDDRFASTVAMAERSAEDGGHSLHATAPDPLPENAAWWIEVELADGTTHVGSVPLR